MAGSLHLLLTLLTMSPEITFLEGLFSFSLVLLLNPALNFALCKYSLVLSRLSPLVLT